MSLPNFQMLDRPYFVKRLVIVALLGLIVYSTWWILHFANHAPERFTGMEVAAIITAINGPLALLIAALATWWRELQATVLGDTP